eukprot:GEMP01003089.1.p1 GENE.GEMP01003089.1~~GEMP01003089.1.p1  ORF type:complete len:1314 (-),score=402.40 GEMP01003089.1:473-4414(-)
MLDSLLAGIFGNADANESERSHVVRSPKEDTQHGSRLVPGQRKTASRAPPRSPPIPPRSAPQKTEFSGAGSLPSGSNPTVPRVAPPVPPSPPFRNAPPEIVAHQPAIPQPPIMPRPQGPVQRSAISPFASRATTAEATNWPMMPLPQGTLQPNPAIMAPQQQQQQQPVRGARWSTANMQNPNPPFGGNAMLRVLPQPQFPSSPSSGRLLNWPPAPLLPPAPVTLPPPMFVPFPPVAEATSPPAPGDAEEQDRPMGQSERKISELTSRMAILEQQIHMDPMIEQRVQETIDDIEHELDRDVWQSMVAPNAPTWQLEQQRASAEARAAQLQYLKQILESRETTMSGRGTSAHESAAASARMQSPSGRQVEPAGVHHQLAGLDPMVPVATDQIAQGANAMSAQSSLQQRLFQAQVAFEQLAESARGNAAESASWHDNYYATNIQERAGSPGARRTYSPPVAARMDGPHPRTRAVSSPSSAKHRPPSPTSSVRAENKQTPSYAARIQSPPKSAALVDLSLPRGTTVADSRSPPTDYSMGRTQSFSSSPGRPSKREVEFETRIAELDGEITDVRRKQYTAFTESNLKVEGLRRDLDNLARSGKEDPELKAELLRQIVELEKTNLKRRTSYNSHLKMLEDAKQSIAGVAERPSASSHSLHSTDVAYEEMHSLLEMQRCLEDRLDQVACVQGELVQAKEMGSGEDEIFALGIEAQRLQCEVADLEGMINAEKLRSEEAWRDCDESSKLCAQVDDMENAVRSLMQQDKDQEAIILRERHKSKLADQDAVHKVLHGQSVLVQEAYSEKQKLRRLEDEYAQRQKELEAKPSQVDQARQADMQRDRDFYMGQIRVLESRLEEMSDAKGNKRDDAVFKALEEQRQFVLAELEAKETVWQARITDQQEQWMGKLRDRERELTNDKSTMQSRIFELEEQLRRTNMNVDHARHLQEEAKSADAALYRASTADQHQLSPPPPHADTNMTAVSPTQRAASEDSPTVHQPHSPSAAAASLGGNKAGVEKWRRPDTSMLPERNLEYLEQVERAGWNSVQWDNGYSLLHWCSKRGFTDICMYLVDLKADVGLVDSNGKNALDYAREKGHYDLCSSLDEVMYTQRFQDEQYVAPSSSDPLLQPPTQLVISNQANQRPDVSQLPPDNLAYLAQVESEGWDSVCWDNGYSLLHWCAKRGLTDLCLYLVELHADPEAQDNKGNSPMDYAKMGEHHDLVQAFTIILQSDDDAPPYTQSLSREVKNTVNLDGSWDVPPRDTNSSDAWRMSSREFLTAGTEDLGLVDSPGRIDLADVPEPFAGAVSLMEEQGWANILWRK